MKTFILKNSVWDSHPELKARLLLSPGSYPLAEGTCEVEILLAKNSNNKENWTTGQTVPIDVEYFTSCHKGSVKIETDGETPKRPKTNMTTCPTGKPLSILANYCRSIVCRSIAAIGVFFRKLRIILTPNSFRKG